jgi:hypothetical protein
MVDSFTEVPPSENHLKHVLVVTLSSFYTKCSTNVSPANVLVSGGRAIVVEAHAFTGTLRFLRILLFFCFSFPSRFPARVVPMFKSNETNPTR